MVKRLVWFRNPQALVKGVEGEREREEGECDNPSFLTVFLAITGEEQ